MTMMRFLRFYSFLVAHILIKQETPASQINSDLAPFPWQGKGEVTIFEGADAPSSLPAAKGN